MKKSAFLRGPEEVNCGWFLGESVDFGQVQNVSVLVESEKEYIKQLLPAPMKPLDDPYIIIYAMDVGLIYGGGTPEDKYESKYAEEGFLETGIMLPAKIDDYVGYFCLALHLNADAPTFYGRDCLGYPKKLANIKMYYDENKDNFVCWEERAGIPFFDLHAKFDGTPNEPDFLEAFEKIAPHCPGHPECGVNLTVKWGNGKHNIGKGKFENLYAHKPFISIGRDECFEISPGKIGSADLKMLWSDKDPWADIPIKRVLGASYDHYNYTMYGDVECVDVEDEKAYADQAFYGFDFGAGHIYRF